MSMHAKVSCSFSVIYQFNEHAGHAAPYPHLEHGSYLLLTQRHVSNSSALIKVVLSMLGMLKRLINIVAYGTYCCCMLRRRASPACAPCVPQKRNLLDFGTQEGVQPSLGAFLSTRSVVFLSL